MLCLFHYRILLEYGLYIIDYSKDHTRRERCIKNCGLLTVAGYNIEKEADELRKIYLEEWCHEKRNK